MADPKGDEIRKAVRENYGEVARAAGTGCCSTPSCCGGARVVSMEDMASGLGYSRDDISAAPEGSFMGLGCGNPIEAAAIQPGETVLDLGSGGGFDCFLAARITGDAGLVIGVDMTPEMVARSRENARKAGVRNVEFRLGELENLPVADGVVDVIVSNCVINLSPDKERVFRETFRVLKPGGRIAISDIVSTAALPEEVRRDLAMHVACIAGATPVGELESMLAGAGFVDVRVTVKEESRTFIKEWVPGSRVEECVVSAIIQAVKPRG
ncbi:MAG TPA: arsenite methyltransferase [Deltaproteobacteria bacterium]|nr:arsenite methyltransferase [Deltaproteobacteria bacterium]HOM30332.1 arsenite methyltransferase [Deltaproteobacteria bacterium]HPP81780.1 arsenite methyltransferase [Deltaproteobacteria bacterium]